MTPLELPDPWVALYPNLPRVNDTLALIGILFVVLVVYPRIRRGVSVLEYSGMVLGSVSLIIAFFYLRLYVWLVIVPGAILWFVAGGLYRLVRWMRSREVDNN